MSAIRVGTSGYAYPHWRRTFYPPRLPERAWLGYYAKVFTTVELNATFYGLPSPDAVDQWREHTPRGFLFAAKGSRFLTHLKRLREPELALLRYFEVVGRLGDKLGPVLWQLPPQLREPDLDRLEHFLAWLPSEVPQVIEARSEGWYTGEVCDLLDRHRVAFCEHDLLPSLPPRHTGGFRYLRFHGATARYLGRYGRRALARHARDLAEWAAQGGKAYAYFNNDAMGHAVRDALDLVELIEEASAARPRDQV